MNHSNIVGGSTAKRVMNCPGSVALVQKMPPQPSNKYADEGTLLHNVIAEIVMTDKHPEEFLHTKLSVMIPQSSGPPLLAEPILNQKIHLISELCL